MLLPICALKEQWQRAQKSAANNCSKSEEMIKLLPTDAARKVYTSVQNSRFLWVSLKGLMVHLNNRFMIFF